MDTQSNVTHYDLPHELIEFTDAQDGVPVWIDRSLIVSFRARGGYKDQTVVSLTSSPTGRTSDGYIVKGQAQDLAQNQTKWLAQVQQASMQQAAASSGQFQGSNR